MTAASIWPFRSISPATCGGYGRNSTTPGSIPARENSVSARIRVPLPSGPIETRLPRNPSSFSPGCTPR